MFNRKLKADSFTGLIDLHMSVQGDIQFEGTLKIDGSVRGDQIAGGEKSCLVIGKEATVTSKALSSHDAIISGFLQCDELKAENILRITKTSRVLSATLYYRILEIEPGAFINDCKMIHLDSLKKDDEKFVEVHENT